MLEVFVTDGGELRKFRDLVQDQVCGGFEETRTYLIRKPKPGLSFYIDDAPQPSDPDDLFWLWSPGFYAGQVIAELQDPAQHAASRFLLDVSPDSKKAGRDIFMKYIEDVAAYSPELLLGREPATQALSGQSSLVHLWIAYARLRAFAGRYIRSIRVVAENPITRLRHHRERLPIHLARHLDVTTVQRLSSNGPLLTAIASLGSGNTGQDLCVEDVALDTPFNEPTEDHPANQQMLRQLLDVIRRVEWVRVELENYREAVSDTETEMRNRLPRRIDFLRELWRELIAIRRRHPFAKVSTRLPSAEGLNAVSGHPHYARAHEFGAKLLRQGISRLDAEERLYTSPTWQIYEAWCFCSMGSYLEAALPGYEWRRQESTHIDVLLEGKCGDSRVRLYYQPTAPSLSPAKNHGYYSISRERRPDLILEYRQGASSRFFCLDAKYMASRQRILDAMGTAHIYRDSIKQAEGPPASSLLLVPSAKEVTDLAAADYRERYGVGCFELSSAESVKLLVDHLLIDFGNK